SLQLAGGLAAWRRGEPQVIDVQVAAPEPGIRRSAGLGRPRVHGGAHDRPWRAHRLDQLRRPTGVFSPEQISIAKDVAAQLAIALEQARLLERVTRQAEELEQRVEQRTTSSSKRSPDRKSTRLNSSHGSISYAVFCLKKKTKQYRKPIGLPWRHLSTWNQS